MHLPLRTTGLLVASPRTQTVSAKKQFYLVDGSVLCLSFSEEATSVAPRTTKRDTLAGGEVLRQKPFTWSALELCLGSSVTDKQDCDKSLKIGKLSPHL